MTSGFRRAAYAAVEEAKAAGLSKSAVVHVASTPGVWRTTVGELQRLLWEDRQRAKRARRAARGS